MCIGDGREHGSGYGTSMQFGLVGTSLINKFIPADTSASGLGNLVSLQININSTARWVAFSADGSDALGLYYQDFFIGAVKAGPYLENGKNFNIPRMKRVVSCDQKTAYYQSVVSASRKLFDGPPSGLHPGAVLDGSYLKNINWENGNLQLSDGTWIPWTSSLVDGSGNLDKNIFNYASRYIDLLGHQ